MVEVSGRCRVGQSTTRARQRRDLADLADLAKSALRADFEPEELEGRDALLEAACVAELDRLIAGGEPHEYPARWIAVINKSSW